MAKEVGFTIVVKGTDQQLKKIGLLEQELKRLSVQRGELIKKSKTGIGLTKEEQVELGKLTVKTKELSDQKRRTTTQIKLTNDSIKAATGSYNKLVLQNKRLVDQLRKLPDPLGKNRKQFQSLSGQINSNTDKLKKMDAAMGRQQRTVGNYSSALKGLKNSFVAAGAAALAAFGARRIFSAMEQFGDQLADVRKTTGLTTDEIDRLTKVLQQIDTRTSVINLLKIAEAAGRLGIAEKDIAGFTETVDKAVVALGDTLEGDAEQIATDLGKISSVFRVEETFGVAEGINKIGSALNELGANTKANERFIVDFTKRLGAIAPLANISAADVLGLGATLDEFGQRTEASSTAVGKLIKNLGQDVPKFAEVAGLSIEDFSEILREDANEAFLLVLEGAQSTDKGVFALTETLENLGITSERAAGVAGVLTAQVERLRENQELSNKAFEEGTSLTTEFEIKNETLAASVAKLGKEFLAVVQDSRLIEFFNNVVKVLVRITQGIKSFIGGQEELQKSTADLFIENNKLISQSKDLIGQYKELSEKAELTADESFKLQQVTRELSDIFGDSVVEIDKETGALTLNIEAIKQQILLRQALQSDQSQELIADKLRLETRLKQIEEDKKFLDTLRQREDVNLTLIALTNQQTDESLGAAKASVDLEFQISKLSTAEQKLADQINNAKNRIISQTIAERDLEEVNESLLESGLDLDAMAKLLAQTSGDTTDRIIGDSDKLTKEIIKNNNTILALQRQLIDSEFTIIEESDQKKRDIEIERFKREKEDLQAQKGEVVAINDTIDALIESKEKEHVNRLQEIDNDAAKVSQVNQLKNITLEEQIAVNAAAESEGTEKEKQQAKLNVQLEFAKKRLELLEASGEAESTEVQLQIEKLKALIIELTEVTEEDEVTGVAKLFSITDEEAELLINKSLELAKAISDAVFQVQKEALARQTALRIKKVQQEADTELKILRNRLDKGIISEEQFKQQKEKIDQEANQKQLAAEKEDFNKRKRIDLLQVIINTALAVTKAIAQFGPPPSPPGIIAIASAVALGAIQAGVIASKKFKKGGELVGPSHEQGGIKAGSVEFEGGEGVVNKQSMRSSDRMTITGTPRQIASEINAYKGYGVRFPGSNKKMFAHGGTVPTPNILPAASPGEFDSPEILTRQEVGELIVEGLNDQTIQVVETDITDTQNDVAIIEALSE